jgi:hypothetical protein
MMVFKPLQDANVSETQRAAAFEGHTDFRAIRAGGRRGCAVGVPFGRRRGFRRLLAGDG